MIITVAEQYGSGGPQIGRALAKRLGIPFYDEETLLAISNEDELSEEEACRNRQEKSEWMYNLATGVVSRLDGIQSVRMFEREARFFQQEDVAKAIAAEGSCVLALPFGRHILKDIENRIDLLVCASYRDRIKRIAKQEELSEREAKKRLIKEERRQKRASAFYTGMRAEEPYSYSLCVNSSELGLRGVLNLVETALQTAET